MVAWRVARSLDVLLDQLNTRYPHRSRASDGAIGDAAHASRSSDHNPWVDIPGDHRNAVTARDYTHDPANGVDIDRLTDELQASRDPRIKYVIANDQIMSGNGGPSPWVWRDYSGSNEHRHHFHLSVHSDPDLFDDARPWNLPSFMGAPAPQPQPPAGSGIELGDRGPEVAQVQRVLNSWYRVARPAWWELEVDGVFGRQTETAVKYLQARAGLSVDGVVGPRTSAVMHL